jgi:hypothetical protein
MDGRLGRQESVGPAVSSNESSRTRSCHDRQLLGIRKVGFINTAFQWQISFSFRNSQWSGGPYLFQ